MIDYQQRELEKKQVLEARKERALSVIDTFVKNDPSWRFNPEENYYNCCGREYLYIFNKNNSLYLEFTVYDDKKQNTRIELCFKRLNNAQKGVFTEVNSIYLNIDKKMNAVLSDIQRRLLSCTDEALLLMNKQKEKVIQESAILEGKENFFNALNKVTKVKKYRNGWGVHESKLEVFSGAKCISDDQLDRVYGNATIEKHYAVDEYELHAKNLNPDLLFKILAIMEAENKNKMEDAVKKEQERKERIKERMKQKA